MADAETNVRLRILKVHDTDNIKAELNLLKVS